MASAWQESSKWIDRITDESRIGELYEQRGEDGEAGKAFSQAAQILRKLAQKIGDEELREGFLSAPQVRRVLERS